MRLFSFSAVVLLLASTLSIAAPQYRTDIQALPDTDIVARDLRGESLPSRLWARKGGGGAVGGGARGGGGGSSRGGGSSGSSGRGSGSSTSSTSNRGGTTKSGSGVRPAYGGGNYYAGGATVPYTAGKRSPKGIAPLLLGAAALSIFPGLWLAGAYSYPYTHPYTFRNHSATTNSTSSNTQKRQDSQGVLETKPVICLCAENYECGCDDDGNNTALNALVGNGDYATLNKTLINVADVNGTDTIVLNGTLPLGTTKADPNASAAMRLGTELSGYWVMAFIVGASIWLV